MKNIIIETVAMGMKTAIVDGVEMKDDCIFTDTLGVLLAALKENGIDVYVDNGNGKLIDAVTNKYVV